MIWRTGLVGIFLHIKITSRAKDWRLVYSEVYSNKSEAYARERLVKSWKSKKKSRS
ncbi:GIY-YIG nuclease family protein [Algoriphagus faecimaris]|uniref:GIY-YIG nuclease family protein n=1 Tax=Algoriphagus faecimaris TaxID=686796 RepID=UPI0030B85E71